MFRRKRSAEDFAEEIKAHLELEADALESEGLSEGEARWKARREFGNIRAAQERFYMKGRWVWLPIPAAESGVCRDGDSDACARDWREYGGIQRDERGAVEVTACGRSRSRGVLKDHQSAPRHRHSQFH